MKLKPASIQMTRNDRLNLRLADGRKVWLESRDDLFSIHMEERNGVSELVTIPLTPAAEKVGLTE
tara:strand:- start:506 stop:700 length:195 start_codon:yes stop_codon:yes gene_type:complete